MRERSQRRTDRRTQAKRRKGREGGKAKTEGEGGGRGSDGKGKEQRAEGQSSEDEHGSRQRAERRRGQRYRQTPNGFFPQTAPKLGKAPRLSFCPTWLWCCGLLHRVVVAVSQDLADKGGCRAVVFTRCFERKACLSY